MVPRPGDGKHNHNPEPGDHASKKTANEQEKRWGLTPVEWLIGVLFASTVGFTINYWTQGRYIPAIWWGFGCWISIGIGTLYFTLQWAKGTTAPPAHPQDDRLVRPYVNIVDTGLVPLEVGKRPIVVVMLKNTGQTPAVDVLAGTRLQIGDLGFFPDAAYTSVDEPRVTLGATEKISMTVSRNEPLRRDELIGIQSGLKELMAHGEVRFTSDPPPATPYTPLPFCYTYDRLTRSMTLCDNRGFINRDKSVFR